MCNQIKMVFFASSGIAPGSVAGGPQPYFNPYYKASCGCGSSNYQVTENQYGARENFTPGGAAAQQAPAGRAAMPPPMMAPAAPMCTLTATAPPAGCCQPAPLHCDCCNGSGFFRASEAYGS